MHLLFQHVFATMNEMLDEILVHYPHAQGAAKQEMQHKLTVLKSMSDSMIEEWLRFEEKMTRLREAGHLKNEQNALPEMKSEAFARGQGYYKLNMYLQAAQSFEQVVKHFPDSIVARMYLAMAYLQMNEFNDAHRHFHLIIPLTDSNKLKAISYNALGCIQAKNNNVEKAQEYFSFAHKADPTFAEPLANMKICECNSGNLQYGSELSSFM